MSNMDQMLKTTSANALFIELNDESAETVSGGFERFTLKNEVGRPVRFKIDGRRYTLKDAQKLTVGTKRGGNLFFIKGSQAGNDLFVQRNLGNGGLYVFRQTKNNPSIIRLITRMKPN